MYIDLKFVVYPLDTTNSSLENTDTIQKPLVITSKNIPQLKSIKISKTLINFGIALTLKSEIRSGTFG